MSDSDSEYSTESQDDMALFLKQPSMMMTHIMIEDPDSHTSHSIRIQVLICMNAAMHDAVLLLFASSHPYFELWAVHPHMGLLSS